MKKTIPALRIWPRPRWPLIHKAKKIYREGGVEALQRWADSLSPEEYEEFIRQCSDLLLLALDKVEQEDKGKKEDKG